MQEVQLVDKSMFLEEIDRAVYGNKMDARIEFSDDGRFNPKALAVLSRSFVDLKFLPAEPDMSKLYTEDFLPKE